MPPEEAFEDDDITIFRGWKDVPGCVLVRYSSRAEPRFFFSLPAAARPFCSVLAVWLERFAWWLVHSRSFSSLLTQSISSHSISHHRGFSFTLLLYKTASLIYVVCRSCNVESDSAELLVTLNCSVCTHTKWARLNGMGLGSCGVVA